MEKTTLINGNGHPYEREVPKVCICSPMNDLAFENLRNQTGIDFQRGPYYIEGQPNTWEQFAKIFLTYNYLTLNVNNWEGNIMYLRSASAMPRFSPLFYEKDGKRYIAVD